MKKALLFCCGLLLYAATAFKNVENVNFLVDTKKSTVKWTGHAQTGVYAPSGTIKVKSGTFNMKDGNDLTSGYIVIDMTTLHQDKEEMENHLKNSDFFDVARFPEAVFKLGGVKDHTAGGELTIKGITRTITFPLTVIQNGEQVEIKANLQIDRTVFGIKYNSASYFQDLGSYAIRNNFELEIDLHAVKDQIKIK